MTGAEQIRVRIATKGIHASDIKHTGLLTDDEIAFIPIEKVYEWIKTDPRQTKPKPRNEWSNGRLVDWSPITG